ncbi:MAG: hypothetical protein ABMA64_22470 [Myxococcota bacterium]
MIPAEQLVARLACALGDTPAGLAVTEWTLDAPIEAQIARDGSLELSLPRGRLATGFDPPLGRLALRVEAAEPSSTEAG